MRYGEIRLLTELHVRTMPGKSGDFGFIAFRDNLWVFNPRIKNPALYQELKRATGIDADNLFDLFERGLRFYPDVLVGMVRLMRREKIIYLDRRGQSAQSPLVKQVAQTLGASKISVSSLADHVNRFYPTTAYKHSETEHTLDEPLIPDVLYHGTALSHMADILRFGLVPGKLTNFADYQHRSVIFLVSEPQSAFWYAQNAATSDGQPVILGVRVPDKAKVIADFDVAQRYIPRDSPTFPQVYHDLPELPSEARGSLARLSVNAGSDFSHRMGKWGYLGRIPASMIETIWLGSQDAKHVNHMTRYKPGEFASLL